MRDRVVCGLIGVVLEDLSAQVSQGSLQKLCRSKKQTQEKTSGKAHPIHSSIGGSPAGF